MEGWGINAFDWVNPWISLHFMTVTPSVHFKIIDNFTDRVGFLTAFYPAVSRNPYESNFVLGIETLKGINIIANQPWVNSVGAQGLKGYSKISLWEKIIQLSYSIKIISAWKIVIGGPRFINMSTTAPTLFSILEPCVYRAQSNWKRVFLLLEQI